MSQGRDDQSEPIRHQSPLNPGIICSATKSVCIFGTLERWIVVGLNIVDSGDRHLDYNTSSTFVNTEYNAPFYGERQMYTGVTHSFLMIYNGSEVHRFCAQNTKEKRQDFSV